MTTTLWGRAVAHKLDAETVATLAELIAASDSLPWSQRRGAEIRLARHLLELGDAAGPAHLARLKVKLLGAAA